MATIVSYQCPNCEAPLSYDPDSGKFRCEYCHSVFDEAELTRLAREKERREAEKAAEGTPSGEPAGQAEDSTDGAEFAEQMEEYQCPNCGATVACTGNTAATLCYYCHTPVIHRGKLSGRMKPNRIVPFSIGREAAQEAFLKFAKKHRFVPRGFFAPEQLEHMQGIYYPFWLTDADAQAGMRAKTTRVRSWRAGNYRYTETSFFRVERDGEVHFEDVTTSAITEADKAMLEGVLPFPSDSLRPFEMPYLSGFLTKKRDMEKEQLAGEVGERMKSYANTLLRNTIQGYTTVDVTETGLDVYRDQWEYALMPVWVLVYRDKRGRAYTYAMNGHTGKIWGELPISYPRLWALAGGIFAAVTAIITLIGGLL